MIRPNENAVAGYNGVLESKPFIETLASGFFVFYKPKRNLSQLFEPCLSCGRRLRLTAGTIIVRGQCGHIAVCRVCRGCVQMRGSIG